MLDTRVEKTSNVEASSVNERIAKVYQYLGLSVLMAMFGSYMGMENFKLFAGMHGMAYWGFVIAEFAILIALFFAKDKSPLNLFLLFGFTFLSGFTLAPTLMFALALDPNILINAFLTTAVAVGAISLYAMNTTRDFSGIGKYLFIALIILIVGSIANIFLQLSMFHLILSIFSGILFSFYLIYDTQNIVNNRFDSPIIAAVGVYIDILNIFISILNIFISMERE